MSAERHSVRAYLSVLTDSEEIWNPELLTRAANIEPTRVWRKGDLAVPGALIKKKYFGWAVDSDLGPEATPREHLESLLLKLAPNWTAFLTASAEYEKVIQFVIEMWDGCPELYFRPEDLKRLSELNSAFDCDMYILPSRETTSPESDE